jgi:hypothetical protein
VIVQNKLTPLSPSEAAAALASAYQRLVGVPPSEAVLALLIAQSALETDSWTKIHNYNFGNQKAGINYPLIVQFRCSEVVKGVEKFFDPPAPECNFRAYESAAAGALDYLRVLHGRPHWWQGLQTEDPSAFVDALATPPKYFTANPALYKSALTSRLVQYGPLAEGALERPTPPPAVPPMGQRCSSTRQRSSMLRSVQGLSSRSPQGPVVGSDSLSASGSLLSESWLVPLEELVREDSGIRTSAALFNPVARHAGGSRLAINQAPRSRPLVRMLRSIARFFARAIRRSAA